MIAQDIKPKVKKDPSSQKFVKTTGIKIINPDFFRPLKESKYMTNNYGGMF